LFKGKTVSLENAPTENDDIESITADAILKAKVVSIKEKN
jgi:hypothetical protein